MDADPARLWSHVLTALHEVHGRVGERSSRRSAQDPRAIAETGLPLLIDELIDCPPVVLVLEDWHIAASRACEETVGAFVERAPSAIQVVVSSRHDPGLPIARLRAHDDLLELRARDLSISSDEADALFRDADVRLTSGDVRRLTERTEGWLAGLRLTAVVLRDQADPRRFVDQFSDGTRDIFDYLARDVLATADSGHPRLHGSLVRARHALAAPLRRRARAHRLRDHAHRARALEPVRHPARRDRLRVPVPPSVRGLPHGASWTPTTPDAVPGLHARASRWFEDHGDLEQAIDHAIAAGDVRRASTLVVRIAVPMLSAGRLATLNRWFDALSWPEAQRDRELAAMRALAARLSGNGRDDVERWLRVARRRPRLRPTGDRDLVDPLHGRDGQLDVPQPRDRRRRAIGQVRPRERARRERVAIRGPGTAGTGTLPRGS